MKEITLGDLAAEKRSNDELKETNKLLKLLVEIYDQKNLAQQLCSLTGLAEGKELKQFKIDRSDLNRWSKAPEKHPIWIDERARNFIRENLLPAKPAHWETPDFTFIDLFAGIGGLRKGFEDVGGKCLFTSEWEQKARRTYLANHFVDEAELDYFLSSPEENPERNYGFMDITQVTLSNNDELSMDEKHEHIRKHIPEHDVLLAGFPCQPFSIAGVSKKNSLGRAHGFECDTQGTLFFDVEQIIAARRPKFFVLENVKNLKSHDKGNTFATIVRRLDEAGYWLSDISDAGETIEQSIEIVRKRKKDPTIIDGVHFTPQHRERVVLVGVRKDLLESNQGIDKFSLTEIKPQKARYTIKEILCSLSDEDREKYTLTPNLWSYLYHYALKHKSKGNGFGFGLVSYKKPEDENSTTRTLSARYYKDGSEILINQHDLEKEYLDLNIESAKRKNYHREEYVEKLLGEIMKTNNLSDIKSAKKAAESLYDERFGRYSEQFDPLYKTPRRLTPQECARLMGFEKPEHDRSKFDKDFRIVCADASAYKQFGNSVVVPVFKAVAELMKPQIIKAINFEEFKVA